MNNQQEEIFPQLAESEDERIRKWLYNMVENLGYPADEAAEKELEEMQPLALAYLEKQKENPKTADSIPSNCVSDAKWASSVLTNAIVSLSDAVDYNCNEPFRYKQEIDDLKKLREEIEKQKEQKLTESILRLTVQGKGVYKICPRCKSRMIRDDSKVYTSMPPQYGYNCPKCGTMEFDTVMYDNPEMEEQIIDSAPLYTIEQVDEKIREAKEWSDEDEKMLLSIINAFRNGTVSTIGQEQWLKNLPKRFNLQPKQEWSEEEKDKLNSIARLIVNANAHGNYLIGDKEATDLQHFIRSIVKPTTNLAEWSENDEAQLDDIEKAISNYYDLNHAPQYHYWLEQRLKSLHPSWKPSKEQIGALDYAYSELFKRKDVGHNILGPLQKLIDQLREQM